jgi:hypothetical protein
VFIHSCNSNIVTNEELKLIPMHRTFAGEDTFCEKDKKLFHCRPGQVLWAPKG